MHKVFVLSLMLMPVFVLAATVSQGELEQGKYNTEELAHYGFGEVKSNPEGGFYCCHIRSIGRGTHSTTVFLRPAGHFEFLNSVFLDNGSPLSFPQDLWAIEVLKNMISMHVKKLSQVGGVARAVVVAEKSEGVEIAGVGEGLAAEDGKEEVKE